MASTTRFQCLPGGGTHRREPSGRNRSEVRNWWTMMRGRHRGQCWRGPSGGVAVVESVDDVDVGVVSVVLETNEETNLPADETGELVDEWVEGAVLVVVLSRAGRNPGHPHIPAPRSPRSLTVTGPTRVSEGAQRLRKRF